jgi:hypothetical protein
LRVVFAAPAGHLNRFVEIEPNGIAAVLRRKAYPDGEARRDRPAHRARGFPEQTRAPLERTAPFVRPGIESRAQELAQEVAVRAVQLDAGETRRVRTHRGLSKVAYDPRDIRFRSRARRLEACRLVSRRTPWLMSSERRRRTQPAVKDLHDTLGAAQRDGRGQPTEARKERVGVDPKFAGRSLPVQRDMRGTCLDDAETTVGAALDPAQLIVPQRPIVVALAVGHRSEPCAITRAQPTS